MFAKLQIKNNCANIALSRCVSVQVHFHHGGIDLRLSSSIRLKTHRYDILLNLSHKIDKSVVIQCQLFEIFKLASQTLT